MGGCSSKGPLRDADLPAFEKLNPRRQEPCLLKKRKKKELVQTQEMIDSYRSANKKYFEKNESLKKENEELKEMADSARVSLKDKQRNDLRWQNEITRLNKQLETTKEEKIKLEEDNKKLVAIKTLLKDLPFTTDLMANKGVKKLIEKYKEACEGRRQITEKNRELESRLGKLEGEVNQMKGTSEGEALYQDLRKLDPSADKKMYWNEKDGWNIFALKSDLNIFVFGEDYKSKMKVKKPTTPSGVTSNPLPGPLILTAGPQMFLPAPPPPAHPKPEPNLPPGLQSLSQAAPGYRPTGIRPVAGVVPPRRPTPAGYAPPRPVAVSPQARGPMGMRPIVGPPGNRPPQQMMPHGPRAPVSGFASRPPYNGNFPHHNRQSF